MGSTIELIQDQFENDPDIEIFRDFDLKKYSTMRLRAQGDLISVKSQESLGKLIKFCAEKQLDYLILGIGANTLLKENIRPPIIKLDLPLAEEYLSKTQDLYHLPASITLSKLSSHAVKFGMIGWEVFTGIPATLGGAVFMNAGTSLGEIGNLVESVKYFNKKGNLIERNISSKDFVYRKNLFLQNGDVIFEVALKNLGQKKEISDLIKLYLGKRNESQPLSEFTSGCTFKNSQEACRAGHYLDIIGMKGFSSKNFKISHKHGNFIVHFGEGSYSEVISFMNFIQQELILQYGVKFEFEVEH
jgi:UDP-N-acetylmuramate dehydrogenase